MSTESNHPRQMAPLMVWLDISGIATPYRVGPPNRGLAGVGGSFAQIQLIHQSSVDSISREKTHCLPGLDPWT
jgi:hypothetical protein